MGSIDLLAQEMVMSMSKTGVYHGGWPTAFMACTIRGEVMRPARVMLSTSASLVVPEHLHAMARAGLEAKLPMLRW